MVPCAHESPATVFITRILRLTRWYSGTERTGRGWKIETSAWQKEAKIEHRKRKWHGSKNPISRGHFALACFKENTHAKVAVRGRRWPTGCSHGAARVRSIIRSNPECGRRGARYRPHGDDVHRQRRCAHHHRAGH